jgi:flagellar hook-associated protein 1 FlgK
VSTFSALNTASTALWAQQRAIDVTGQNVANVNTDGYSRQRADLESINGNVTPAMWSTTKQVGGGVNADNITRIRDAFLEARAQNEHGITASLTVQDTTYSEVQDAFREPGNTGLQQQLSDMWAGWGDVMNNSTDPGARSQLLQRASTLVAGIHNTSGTLTQQWQNHRDAMVSLVQDVNATASSIADLNRSIKSATLSNLPVNELMDKRDALVMHLSDQIGATATTGDDGTLNVVVGGTQIVSGISALTLQLQGATDPTTVSSNPPQIVTSPGGTVLPVGGNAQGHLASMTAIIPTYLNQLDGFAQQMADQVNALQVNSAGNPAYDQAGNPGVAMFDNGSGSTTGITAANLRLALTDGSQLAAASLPPDPITGVSADNGNAAKLYQARLDPAGIDVTYRKSIVALGVQASTATTSLTTQSAISTQVDASRESTSGVNIDEEMTNMLQYQHGYAAAGKLVSTINQMLDTVINMVG